MTLKITYERGHPLEYKPTFFFVSRLIDLRSGFGRRMQLLQVYRSGSTRSVFIYGSILSQWDGRTFEIKSVDDNAQLAYYAALYHTSRSDQAAQA